MEAIHGDMPPNQGGPSRLNVLQIEQPIECDQAPAGQAHTWAPLSASVRTHVVSVVRIQQSLDAFYSSGLFKAKVMHLKQARTATLDKSISHMCNTAGLTSKLDRDGARPLFVVIWVLENPGPPPAIRLLFKEKATTSLVTEAIACWTHIGSSPTLKRELQWILGSMPI
ncbi:hypothetical protein EDD21DRAFT_433747 [Dissophora ornata]|nr:hypothetical protein EDD21DRAFT_433747 [Dissophora ornata]